MSVNKQDHNGHFETTYACGQLYQGLTMWDIEWVIEDLELFKTVEKYYGDLNLRATTVFAIQHILESTLPLIHRLHRAGVDFHNIFLLGKAYSTSPPVYEYIRSLGVQIDSGSLGPAVDLLQADYRVELRARTSALMDTLPLSLNADTNKLLIIDDGGMAIQEMSSRPSVENIVKGIEQTRSGIKIIKQIPALTFPVVNVAEARTKLDLESPKVAETLIAELVKRRRRLSIPARGGATEVLVCGFGAIGAAIAVQLKAMGNTLTIVETDALTAISHRVGSSNRCL